MKHVKIITFACVLSVIICIPVPSSAADRIVSDERGSTAIKDDQEKIRKASAKKYQLRSDDRKPILEYKDWKLHSGGFLASTFRHYRDIDNQDTVPDFLKWAWSQDAYVWFDVRRAESLNLFFGVQNTYTDRHTGPGYTGVGDDNYGPRLDLAYAEYEGLRLGRQFFSVGRGLAYSAVHDGVRYQYHSGDWTNQYFFSHTLPHEDNIDLTVPGFDKEGDRIFYGAEWIYSGVKNWMMYGYVVGQTDLSGENPQDISQKFHYDSFYFGGGIEAYLPSDIQIWGEAIYEVGDGYTDTSSGGPLQDTDVRAWAYTGGIKKRWDVPMKPIAEFETSFGSGDHDRFFVTDTVGGDTSGIDRNFLYFGSFEAGYALQPRLSNLYITMVGFSFQPFESIAAPGTGFAIGAKGYHYRKDENSGGASDFQSGRAEPDVGNEIDIYFHWRMTDSLTWSLRNGTFFPGDAYLNSQKSKTRYFYSRLIWNW